MNFVILRYRRTPSKAFALRTRRRGASAPWTPRPGARPHGSRGTVPHALQACRFDCANGAPFALLNVVRYLTMTKENAMRFVILRYRRTPSKAFALRTRRRGASAPWTPRAGARPHGSRGTVAHALQACRFDCANGVPFALLNVVRYLTMTNEKTRSSHALQACRFDCANGAAVRFAQRGSIPHHDERENAILTRFGSVSFRLRARRGRSLCSTWFDTSP
jgi:hypothetical protein